MPFNVNSGDDIQEVILRLKGGAVPTYLAELKMNYPLLWHDIRMLKRRYDIVQKLQRIKERGHTIVDVFEDHAEKNPDKPCVLCEDECYSYREVNERANDLARWLWAKRRMCRGDVVAVLLHNEPAIAWMWFALAKIGLVSSMLNTNMKPFSLIHCIKVCGAKSLLCGAGKCSIFCSPSPSRSMIRIISHQTVKEAVHFDSCF